MTSESPDAREFYRTALVADGWDATEVTVNSGTGDSAFAYTAKRKQGLERAAIGSMLVKGKYYVLVMVVPAP